jgi:disulfide oxidoreductase YuzD
MRIIRRCFFDKRRPVGYIGKRLKYCFNLERRNRRKLLVRYYPGNKNIMQAVVGVVKTGVSVCNNVSMQISNSKLNKDVIKNVIKNKHIEIEEDHRYINIGSCETTNDKDLNYTNKINIVITSKPITIVKIKQVNLDNSVAYKGNELLIPTVPINEIVSD